MLRNILPPFHLSWWPLAQVGIHQTDPGWKGHPHYWDCHQTEKSSSISAPWNHLRLCHEAAIPRLYGHQTQKSSSASHPPIPQIGRNPYLSRETWCQPSCHRCLQTQPWKTAILKRHHSLSFQEEAAPAVPVLAIWTAPTTTQTVPWKTKPRREGQKTKRRTLFVLWKGRTLCKPMLWKERWT